MLDLSSATRLWVLAPHPDDETIAVGGLIQQVRAAGGAVRVLQATNGDNNPWPQRWLERRVCIDASARQRWGRRRHTEAGQALRQLGVPDALHVLNWPDGLLASRLPSEYAAMKAALRDELETFRPNLLALPTLDDRHPDHGSLHVLLRLALRMYADEPQLLGYLVHGRATAATRWLELPAPSRMQANKLAALACYRTQTALSGGRMRNLASRTERFAIIDGKKRESANTRVPWRPAVWLRPWLRLMMIDSGGAQDWRWRDAPLQREADRGWRLHDMQAAGPRFVRLYLTLPSPWIFDRWGWREL